MRKSLLLFCAVLCAALVMFSCTPVSDCGRVATVKDEFGKSTLTFSVAGMNQSGRTVLPNDWTDTRAAALTYKLTGSKTQGGDNVITTSNVYSYNELRTNAARIDLEPAVWYLTLTAYQGAESDSPVVMQSVETAVDLTQGNATKQFTLVAVRGTEGATGDVSVVVEFPKPERFAKVVAGLYESGTVAMDDPVSGVAAVTVEDGDEALTLVSGNIYSFTFAKNSVQTGSCYFSAKFFDVDDNVIAFVSEPVIIDGGNLSSKTKTLTDIFRKPPVAPSDLAVSYIFNENGMNALPLQNSGIVPTVYEAVLTWTDNSDNETGFELIVTDSEPDETVEYTITAGSLGASSTSVTIELETGKVYSMKLRAKNSYSPAAESDTSYISLSDVNLFTVTYILNGAVVRETNTTTTGNQYTKYVVPYTKPASAIQTMTTEGYPRIERANFNFTGWLDALNNVVSEIAAGNTDNIELTASWSSTLTSTVAMPSYGNLAGNLIVNQPDGSSVSVQKGQSITLSAASDLTNVSWTLLDDSWTPTNTGVSLTDSTFTWDTTGFAANMYNLTITGTREEQELQETIIIQVTN